MVPNTFTPSIRMSTAAGCEAVSQPRGARRISAGVVSTDVFVVVSRESNLKTLAEGTVIARQRKNCGIVISGSSVRARAAWGLLRRKALGSSRLSDWHRYAAGCLSGCPACMKRPGFAQAGVSAAAVCTAGEQSFRPQNCGPMP